MRKFAMVLFFMFTFTGLVHATVPPPIISWDHLLGVEVGMSVQQVEKIFGQKLSSDVTAKPNEKCYIASPKKNLKGIYFIITHWKVSAFGVTDQASFSVYTQEGAKIGMPQEEVLKLYPKAKKEDHPYYAGGKIITVSSHHNSNFNLLIATDGKKVIYMQGGKSPEVFYEEGCQ